MAGRGERTREHILDVAERLYGAEGVAKISLRRIRIAAGQRNDAAVQYHFGDRDGIIRGLSDRHLPRVEEIAKRLIGGHGRRPSTRQLVETVTRPWAEYVTRGPSERAYVKIIAELMADPELGFETMRDNTLPELAAVGVTLYERMSARMPTNLAVERLWTVSRFAVQTSADRAVLVDDPNPARPILPDDEFVENLVDMAAGALTARRRTVA